MRPYVLAMLAVLMGTSAEAVDDRVHHGDKVRVSNGSAIACPSESVARRIKDVLVPSRDEEAARKLFHAGKCAFLRKNSELIVEEANPVSEQACVRPRGQPDCLWVWSRFLNKSSR